MPDPTPPPGGEALHRHHGATWSTADAEAARQFAIDAARLARDDHCEDVLVLDVRDLSQITDFIVIATGTSDRQMASTVHHLVDLGAERGFPVFGANTQERSTWQLADFVDVMVHVFEANTRAHYDLEMLWGDAPRVEWERPDQKSRNRAGL